MWNCPLLPLVLFHWVYPFINNLTEIVPPEALLEDFEPPPVEQQELPLLEDVELPPVQQKELPVAAVPPDVIEPARLQYEPEAGVVIAQIPELPDIPISDQGIHYYCIH